MQIRETLRRKYRGYLLRMRVLPVPGDGKPPDVFSAEYLAMGLQAKRLRLSRIVSRYSLRNVLLWPYLGLSTLSAYVDLRLSTAIVDSMVLEQKLMSGTKSGKASEGRCESQ